MKSYFLHTIEASREFKHIYTSHCAEWKDNLTPKPSSFDFLLLLFHSHKKICTGIARVLEVEPFKYDALTLGLEPGFYWNHFVFMNCLLYFNYGWCNVQPNIGPKLSILNLIFAYSSWLVESLLLEMRWLHEFDVNKNKVRYLQQFCWRLIFFWFNN